MGLGEVGAVSVVILLSVPLVLPALLTEARVVLTAGNEEVTVGDGVENWEARGGSNRIGVGRQLRALQKEAASVGVLLECVLSCFDHARLHLDSVDLVAEGNGLEAWNVFATDDVVAGLLGIHTTLVSNQVTHRLESFAISSHDDNLFVFSVSASHGWEL